MSTSKTLEKMLGNDILKIIKKRHGSAKPVQIEIESQTNQYKKKLMIRLIQGHRSHMKVFPFPDYDNTSKETHLLMLEIESFVSDFMEKELK